MVVIALVEIKLSAHGSDKVHLANAADTTDISNFAPYAYVDVTE